MDSRGYQLANAFDAATDRLVGVIRGMTDDQWASRANEDEWTVAQEALHLGVWMEIESDWYARLAQGKFALPLSKEAADRINDLLMAENPSPTREEALLSIAGNRTMVRHFLIGLSDEQLAGTIPSSKAFISGSPEALISLDDLASRMLVGHVENHVKSIEATIATG